LNTLAHFCAACSWVEREAPRLGARPLDHSEFFNPTVIDGAAAHAVVNGLPYGLEAYDLSWLRSCEMPIRVDRERIVESEAGRLLSASTTSDAERSLAFRTRRASRLQTHLRAMMA
jgi:hypothetical protein